MSWRYEQRTAILSRDNVLMSSDGYSGNGPGKNNPAMENVPDVGPLPRGKYHIGTAYHHPEIGPLTMNLEPDEANEMFGRGAFRIHGDSLHDPGNASHGCIVQRHDVRLAIALSGDTDLEVI